ncbi:MAG: response regulator transcription factor [Armatimonadetes bacterium]|nr:response regulator transcription factor [Armatimonadota bacterium]
MRTTSFLTRPRVLIIEDDPDVAAALQNHLTSQGFTVWVAPNGTDGLHKWRKIEPDAVVLDLILPDLDGYDVCNEIRREAATPIIIASARTSVTDRVCGLELGADDYICKPFAAKELVARLKALLQRCQRYAGLKPEAEVIEVGPLQIDRTNHHVLKNGQPIELTPKEFDLLWVLAQHANHTVPSRRLLWDVWGYDESIRTRTLDVHIGRLRRKLEDDPHRPKLIKTVPTVGYMLQGVPRPSVSAADGDLQASAGATTQAA